MNRTLLYILIAVVADGVVALAGGLIPTEVLHRRRNLLLAFAAGTLLGVAGFDLIPEASTRLAIGFVGLLVVAGFLTFVLIERLLGTHAAGQHGHRPHMKLAGPFLLVGDALHNFTDGIAIAVAFLASERVGIATTLAVVLHELPQEIGDYAILRAQGYGKGRALFWLFLVQLTAGLGALGAYWMATDLSNVSAILSAWVAGGFVYIAVALFPELWHLQEGRRRFATVEAIALIFGGVMIAALVGWVH